ncbi:MAG: transposase [Gammaproteobacteria bacterium]|jgi:putative transposase
MPRANRFFIPDQVLHVTHRCHKQDYLLKFHKDRRNWIRWLFEARKRYGLQVLNYMVTANHVHLLVNTTQHNTLQCSMQLIAGRTAQEYNQRKHRKGAYWEDRYHATVVETNEHLWRCLVYIDLNMVRAGVVKHPSEWRDCGYHEIQHPPQRRRIIDRQLLMRLLKIKSERELQQTHRHWIEATLTSGSLEKDTKWSGSLAVGSEEFVTSIKGKLGIKSKYRQIDQDADSYVLREPDLSYQPLFEGKNGHLSVIK